MSTRILERAVLAKAGMLGIAIAFAVPACAKSPVPPSSAPSAPPPSPAPSAPIEQGLEQQALDPQRATPISISPPRLESLRSAARQTAEQLKRERHPWIGSSPERWRTAIADYVSSVKPGNQTFISTAAVPFAQYLNGMHNRFHPLFADFLSSLDDLPAAHPLNEKHLVTRVEIVLTGDGQIKRMGVVKTSGAMEFDSAVLDAVDRAQPFAPPPSPTLSADGNVYIHWEFHRDEVYACSTMNARPFLLVEPANPARVPPPASPPTPSP